MINLFWLAAYVLFPALIYQYDPFFGLFLPSVYLTVTCSSMIASAFQALSFVWIIALFGRVYKIGHPEKIERLKQYLFVTLPQERPVVEQTLLNMGTYAQQLYQWQLSQRLADGTDSTLRLLLEKTNFEETAQYLAAMLWKEKVIPSSGGSSTAAKEDTQKHK